MHGMIGGPYYKGKGGGTNMPSSADNTVHNTGGTPGRSMPQQPIAGSSNPGPPASMKKALAKKSGPYETGMGPSLPNRNTTAAGSR